MNTSKQLAKYEISWWQAHHRRNRKLLLNQMAKLYSLQFNLPYRTAFKAVQCRVKATKEHDIAEKLEDENKIKQSNMHWKKAESLIEKHFEILEKSRINKIKNKKYIEKLAK